MNLINIHTGFLATNTYIVYNESGDAIVIDPGDEYEKIKAKLDGAGLTCKYVLLTHGHFDHVNEAKRFQQDGALVFIHGQDAPLVQKSTDPKFKFARINCFEPDVLLMGGEVLKLSDIEVKVMHTPGHSAGCVCYIIGTDLFSGDTLFLLDAGRTDLYSGNELELQKSLERLFELEFDYAVRPGHGDMTTLFFEAKNNPYAK